MCYITIKYSFFFPFAVPFRGLLASTIVVPLCRRTKTQELSTARAALKTQERENERWQVEAERAAAKEKEARRALESARTAAGDAMRRYNCRALRVELQQYL